MAVSVPRKIFRRAVDRNLLKRRIREAYRILKPGLYDKLQQQQRCCYLVIQYRAKEITDYNTIKDHLEKALAGVVSSLNE